MADEAGKEKEKETLSPPPPPAVTTTLSSDCGGPAARRRCSVSRPESIFAQHCDAAALAPLLSARAPSGVMLQRPAVAKALPQLLYELFDELSRDTEDTENDDAANDCSGIRKLLRQLVEAAATEISSLQQLISTDIAKFEAEWAALTWSLLVVTAKLRRKLDSRTYSDLEEHLNLHIINLVNLWRNPTPISSTNPDILFQWQQFNPYLTNVLHSIHMIYSQGLGLTTHDDFRRFQQNELALCLASFKQLCLRYSAEILEQLRINQVERVSLGLPVPRDSIRLVENYYSKVLYCMSVIIARLQGFRFWAFSYEDPISDLMDSVAIIIEQLLAESLYCCEPNASPILVTNNLFPFRLGCLVKGPTLSSFSVQIVSEETAFKIQNEVRKSVNGGTAPSSVLSGSDKPFSSAALLAMKPTSGTKRNNSTASAEGGNTAHKKSDVNSKESVTLPAAFSEKHGSWGASYPHLLCTTRQKDTCLLDARSNQIGKRSLFYFYVRGSMFSTRKTPAEVYTLSLPFTIATRRNQDCQVQRMMSSYTATCFWLYGTCNLDGLLLKWTEADILWPRFQQLFKAYFRATAEVTRDLADRDFLLLEQKINCSDCTSRVMSMNYASFVSFKNIMCPHLRYEFTDVTPTRFSIWRALLEILQFFQDTKTNTKAMWDDYFLLGFLDIQEVQRLLSTQPVPTICLYLSYAAGGSICFAARNPHGDVLYLEPLDLKRLQTKTLSEYASDIAAAEHIEYLLNAKGHLVPLRELELKYKSSSDGRIGSAMCNVTHLGDVNSLQPIQYTPIRIAVVTCAPDCKSPRLLSPLAPPPYSLSCVPASSEPQAYCGIAQHGDFLSQLQELMKMHGKHVDDLSAVMPYLSYADHSAPSFSMHGI